MEGLVDVSEEVDEEPEGDVTTVEGKKADDARSAQAR